MATAVMSMEGSYDAAKKELSFTGEYFDPVHGSHRKLRSVTRLVSADRQEIEMYDAGADGKESKTMESVYTRRP